MARRLRVVPADALSDGIKQIKQQAGVPEAFPADVLAEAQAAASKTFEDRERVDIDFVTIDPPGARDLDQALHIARAGDGYTVSYAIADPGVFIAPGGPLDRDTHARGVTVYAPDGKVPLHPPILSEGAGSLLPGEWRPAVLWTFDLDVEGVVQHTDVRRVLARSVAQHTYEEVPADLAPLLEEVGRRRIELERKRGGVQLTIPEQEVVHEEGDGWTVRYRPPNPFEDYNAQISLMTGMAAAELMLANGYGILRTQPPPSEKDFAKLRLTAQALGVEWIEPYPEFIRSLDPSNPRHAAVMQGAASIGRGASYTAFEAGETPSLSTHWAVAAPYAHATAPLRRLQDRYVTECCLGNHPDGLKDLPRAMANGARKANTVDRGVVDLVEALVLEGREGESFHAVVIDEAYVQVSDPAVRAKLEGEAGLGSELDVRLKEADPKTREVVFTPA